MRPLIETKAFPQSLNGEVARVVSRLVHEEDHQGSGNFCVQVQGELLEIPNRLYYRSTLLDHAIEGSELSHQISACLGTRHHDGFVRQRCLERLLPVRQPWVVPYVVALLGEYVLPIIMLIEAHSRSDELGLYGEFLARNTQYLKKTERRVMSYWDAYHRHPYPQYAQYPGFLAMSALKNAANSAAATIDTDLSNRGVNA